MNDEDHVHLSVRLRNFNRVFDDTVWLTATPWITSLNSIANWNTHFANLLVPTIAFVLPSSECLYEKSVLLR